MTTLSATLEAALIGQATKQVMAIDEELARMDKETLPGAPDPIGEK